MLRRALIGGALFLAGVWVGFAGNRVFGYPEFYGSFDCNACKLKSPGPEAATVAFLDYMSDWLARTKPNYVPIAGDRIMVCNEGYCVIYTRNSQNFTGGTPMERREASVPGGGGGAGEGVGGGVGSGPGGGYNGPIGGGVGGGGGTVTVGPIGGGGGGGGGGTVTVGDIENPI